MSVEPVTPSPAPFDYSRIAMPDACALRLAADKLTEKIGALNNSMHEAQRRVALAAADIGADLVKVKDRLPHGTFGGWCRSELGIEPRTAQNYMNAARLLGSLPPEARETISLLPPATIYALAAPGLPDDIRAGVLTKVVAGEMAPSAARKAVQTAQALTAKQKRQLERRAAAREREVLREREREEDRKRRRDAALREILLPLIRNAPAFAVSSAARTLGGPHQQGIRWAIGDVLLEILLEMPAMQLEIVA
jgi:hypothetical protein